MSAKNFLLKIQIDNVYTNFTIIFLLKVICEWYLIERDSRLNTQLQKDAMGTYDHTQVSL